MMLIRNKTSGKYFIALEEESDQEDRMLMITPDGAVKRLEQRLFDAPDWVAPQHTAADGRLTQAQRAKYEAYLDTLMPRGQARPPAPQRSGRNDRPIAATEEVAP